MRNLGLVRVDELWINSDCVLGVLAHRASLAFTNFWTSNCLYHLRWASKAGGANTSSKLTSWILRLVYSFWLRLLRADGHILFEDLLLLAYVHPHCFDPFLTCPCATEYLLNFSVSPSFELCTDIAVRFVFDVTVLHLIYKWLTKTPAEKKLVISMMCRAIYKHKYKAIGAEP